MAFNFAESQLKKYGWSAGKGLGKNEEGRTRAVQAKIKNDTNGLGQSSEDWGFAWWDQIYNDALNNLKIVRVNNDEDKGRNSYDGHVKLTKINKKDTGPPRTRTGIISTNDELGYKEGSINGAGFDFEDETKNYR
ncbi:4675_t:CDS:2 [Ambispora gerdemannii]|uniref:4675_t:CDS:1 n=1 Tax=Ambispora gerdemannii TaxID=144530 RepID=A0A9N8WQL3_9GLOM|nr:4675_t:CDS:2 [Ambispora gerdemannii]